MEESDYYDARDDAQERDLERGFNTFVHSLNGRTDKIEKRRAENKERKKSAAKQKLEEQARTDLRRLDLLHWRAETTHRKRTAYEDSETLLRLYLTLVSSNCRELFLKWIWRYISLATWHDCGLAGSTEQKQDLHQVGLYHVFLRLVRLKEETVRGMVPQTEIPETNVIFPRESELFSAEDKRIRLVWRTAVNAMRRELYFLRRTESHDDKSRYPKKIRIADGNVVRVEAADGWVKCRTCETTWEWKKTKKTGRPVCLWWLCPNGCNRYEGKLQARRESPLRNGDWPVDFQSGLDDLQAPPITSLEDVETEETIEKVKLELEKLVAGGKLIRGRYDRLVRLTYIRREAGETFGNARIAQELGVSESQIDQDKALLRDVSYRILGWHQRGQALVVENSEDFRPNVCAAPHFRSYSYMEREKIASS